MPFVLQTNERTNVEDVCPTGMRTEDGAADMKHITSANVRILLAGRQYPGCLNGLVVCSTTWFRECFMNALIKV